MKQNLLAWCMIVALTVAAKGQVVYIPDQIFKNSLLLSPQINTNGDNEIQVSEAEAYTGILNVGRANIADLTGIEAFINIIELSCQDNRLTSLDLSKNTRLVFVNASLNQLTSLDLRYNRELEWLYVIDNKLTTINLRNGNNRNMRAIQARDNPHLSCIQIDDYVFSTTVMIGQNFPMDPAWNPTTGYSEDCGYTITIPDPNFKAYLIGNPAINTNGDSHIQEREAIAFAGTIDCSNRSIGDLTGIQAFENITALNCVSNGISTLDLSKNRQLESLYCNNNYLSSLDLSANTSLSEVLCNNNRLSSLDVSGLASLSYLWVHHNQLQRLKLKNGNNRNLTNLRTGSNQLLVCIEVDDAAYSETNWRGGGTNSDIDVDARSRFNEDCESMLSCTVHIPDVRFKAHLVGIPEINTNRDGEIQCYEAAAYSGAINCAAAGIEDLTGIEAFTSLTALRCGYNALTTLDLSNNPMLTTLYCFSNQLTSVNIADNLLLTDLRCDDNQLTSLDVSGSPALNILYCSGNQLTSVDVSNNPNLRDLRCSRNLLTSLDISDVIRLTTFVAFQNQLNTLILADNNILSVVNIGDNRFTSFDATGLPVLTQLSVERNQLRSLNVANGNNTAFSYFHSQENPDLRCIQVDDVAYSNSNWQGTSFQKNTGIPFGEDCYALTCIVDIPDATFKTFLLRDPVININGDQHIQCSEAEAFTGAIDCSNRVIADLTGIEAFVNVTQLICTNASLTTLNLNHNNALTVLHCDGNRLTALDISGSTRLTSLRCHNNQLTSLDISNNTSLQTVWAYLNQLTDVVSVGNTALEELNIRNNNLTDFDATGMTSLKRFSIENNQLASLNVANGANRSFTHFTSHNNPALECIQVDDESYSAASWLGESFQKSLNSYYSEDCSIRPCEVNIPDASFKAYLLANRDINRNGDNRIQCEEAEAFTGSINCAGRSISDLTGIEAFVNINGLYCQENQLTSLDLRHHTALQFLTCNRNSLAYLNISSSNALLGLNCGYNQLSVLDLSANTNLTELKAENNRLTILNLSAHTALNQVILNGNQLTSLNIRNGNNNNIWMFNASNNPALACIQVDDVIQSVARWSVCCADDKQSFSENCYVASCIVQIPDNRFKTCLLANGLINTNGDSEIQCEEAEIFSGAIECTNMNIADLAGIEYFVNVTELNVSGNALTALDLSNLPALKKIAVENNQLTSLNVANGNNSDFVYFSAYNNPALVSIEVDDAGYSAASWTGSGFQFDVAATFRDPGEVTSVGDRILTAQINLYPNPADNIVTISYILPGTTLKISDMTGREVYSGNVQAEYQTIYTGDWNSGVYFIQIGNNHGSVIKKLLISR